MTFLPGRQFLRLALVLLILVPGLEAANIGTVIPVVGQVADLIHDPARNLVYLANPTRNQLDIYSVDLRRLTGSIPTGTTPASLALSMDGNTLYVANVGSNSINVINLNTQRVTADFTLSSRPDAIAVGSDENVLILGTAGLQRLDPIAGRVFPIPISPPAIAPAGLPITPASPTPGGFLAGLVSTANGNLIIGLSTNRLFVYEVASASVLRSRNVTGLRAIISAAPDGSRFMAGPFLFDTQTLTILGRTGTVAPNITGGSAFSPDGNAVYATFSTQTPINPLNTNNPQNQGGAIIPGGIPGQTGTTITAGVLQILRSSSLTPQLGLRLPELIISKLIASADGQNLFANSTSGLLVIPIGQLSSLPILDVATTNVVLSVDPCNRTIATVSVQVRNLGSGRMTFAATPSNQGAPIVLNRGTGVTPTNLTISFDPRTITTQTTLQYAVVLVSPEAVNIEPAILVNLNYRDVSQRGAIVPMTGVGVDLQMDAARQRLYIANYTQDQIEVFSLASQTFLPPIRVGNRPLSMTMVNPNTLVVANAGAEGLSVIDLDSQQEVEQISMGPIPLTATPFFPKSVASSANAILFSAVPLPNQAGQGGGNGSLWQLSLLTHSAFPRLNLGTGTPNQIQGRNFLVAPSGGSSIAIVEGNGNARLYDPLADTFGILRPGAVAGLRGTAAATADGNTFVVDNVVLNSVLVSQGLIAPTTAGLPIGQQQLALAFGVAVTGTTAIRVQAGTPAAPMQSLQRFNLNTLQSNLQIALPEPVMDISPALVGVGNGNRQWPPRAVALELGQNNQTQLLPRGLALDNANNVYLLSYSGLSIVSLASAAGSTPTFTANNVLNSASRTSPVAGGSLISIIGSNLAETASALNTPLPLSLGGVCVTANEVAIPLLITSSNQIDAQLPPNLSGRVTLTVRSTRLGVSSPGVQVQVNAAAPGLFSLDIDGQKRAALFHANDFMLVTPDYPAERDEYLVLYATGVGPTTPTVPAGQLTPETPVSRTTQSIGVSIGGHPYAVVSSELAPGYVGVYQITIYVPGNRVRGDNLAVVVTAGGSSSATTNAPLAAVQ